MRNQLSSKGFTLVEVLVATGLVALLSLVMTTLMVKMQKDVSVYSAKSGVESMRNQVRMNAINGAAILKSAMLTENPLLSTCLNTNNCSTTKSDFKLVDALGVPLSGKNVYYDLQGKPCKEWNVSCPLKISSQMQLICGGAVAVASCPKAQAMNVFVQIDYHTDLSKARGVELRPITDTVTVALASYYNTQVTNNVINQNNNSTIVTGSVTEASADLICETGSYMTGVDTSGKVICMKVASNSGSGGSGSDGNGRDGDGGGGGQGKDGGGDGGGAGGSCSM
jgi:prepilin-type N-terminal cleavage/methylation domain-containing protein